MKTRSAIAAALALTVLAGCSETPSSPQPQIEAALVPAGAKPDAKGATISMKELASIATNRASMSCYELFTGSLQAMGLKAVGTSSMVKADAATRRLAGTMGAASYTLINSEKDCHCDGLTPQPGYELFERRTHLLGATSRGQMKPELMAYYPKDATGQPRFLEPGELIPAATLQSLPPVTRSAPVRDDCDYGCKQARKRTNDAAVKEGKPEPWPGLMPAPKVPGPACRKPA